MTKPKPPEPPARLEPDPPIPSRNGTVTMRSKATVPIVVLIVTIALTNAGLWYSLQVQGAVLNTQVEHLGTDVGEIKGLVKSATLSTNVELGKLRDEITELKVKVAALEAKGD